MITKIGSYTLESEIGKGSFASVKIGRHKITGTSVAIKLIEKSALYDEDLVIRFKREVNIMKNTNHPFIAEFFDLIEDEYCYYLVMEYVENGNLLDFVNKKGKLNEKLARTYFCELISVLEYLHTQLNIAHRDLKAENILLDRNYNIRLIDFGLSNCFTPESPLLTTACGSPAYASPEMVKGEQYTTNSDIWSAGILLYAMCAGELPFEDENIHRLLQKIAFTEPKYPVYFTSPLIDLLEKLLKKDPKDRITLTKIKEHPWFSQYEYHTIMNKNFGISNSWRVRPISQNDTTIDTDIVQQLTSFGVDCQSLLSQLFSGEASPITSLYRMLRKNKITEDMKELVSIEENNLYSNYLPPSPKRRNEEINNTNNNNFNPKRQRRPSFGGFNDFKVSNPIINNNNIKKQSDRHSCEIISSSNPAQRMQRRTMTLGSKSPRNLIQTPVINNSQSQVKRVRSSSVRENIKNNPQQEIMQSILC